MIHPRTSLIRLFLTATVGLGLAVAPVQAELLVNGFASSGQVCRTDGTATFQSRDRGCASEDTSGQVLDGLFHPLGLMMAVSFFPPGFPMNQPTPAPAVPGDPTITVAVPGLPQVVAPPPTDIGTPITQVISTPPTTTGSSVTPPVQKSPEPGTLVSGLLGAALLGWRRWRRRQAA